MQNLNLSKFPKIRSPNLIHSLDLSNNPINSFEGMPEIPFLESLNMNSTKIDSLRFFIPNSALSSVFLNHTPFSLNMYYQIMLLVVCGQQLEFINGKQISSQTKRIAAKFSSIIYDFLLNGWILTSLQPIILINHYTHQKKTLCPPQDKSEIDPQLIRYHAINSKIETSSQILYEKHVQEEEEETTQIITTPRKTSPNEQRTYNSPITLNDIELSDDDIPQITDMD